jgi:hypothetical protein
MSKAISSTAPVPSSGLPAGYADIRGSIVELLDAARQAAVRSVNALMTASYWEIGRRIVEAEQKGRRGAGYGEQLIERLSLDLTRQFGRGFSRQNLQQMRLFFLTWPIRQKVSGESPELTPPGSTVDLRRNLTQGGADKNLDWFYAASPRLTRYSIGLREPR